MAATQAFRDAFARRVREGVRRYMERNDLWSFGATEIVKLIRAEGVSVTSWTVKAWMVAKSVPTYKLGMALAKVLEMDYHEMMAPEPPQSAEDAPQTNRAAIPITDALVPRGKVKRPGKRAS